MKKTKYKNPCVQIYLPIHVTKHAIVRHRQRSNYRHNDNEVIENIKTRVSMSRLIGMSNTGEEYRIYCGEIYVCKIDMVNGIRSLVVVTELCVGTKLRFNVAVG